MKLENQVVSLELAKKLKELGVKQESLFYHFKTENTIWQITSDVHSKRSGMHVPAGKKGFRELKSQRFSAFTVAELREMLKEQQNQIMFGENEYASIAEPLFEITESNNRVNALAKLLLYLITNGFLKI